MSARGSGWAIWVIVLALVAAACGGEDGDGDGGQVSAPPTESQSAADAAASEQADDGAGGSDGAQTYVVRSGDTLSQIANRFDTTVPALVQANNIADPDVIDVGQELTIP
jgi:LysM repeat protein